MNLNWAMQFQPPTPRVRISGPINEGSSQPICLGSFRGNVLTQSTNIFLSRVLTSDNRVSEFSLVNWMGKEENFLEDQLGILPQDELVQGHAYIPGNRHFLPENQLFFCESNSQLLCILLRRNWAENTNPHDIRGNVASGLTATGLASWSGEFTTNTRRNAASPAFTLWILMALSCYSMGNIGGG